MEKSPHSMLVGQGAQDFAIVNGFPVESNSALQTQKSREAFEVTSLSDTWLCNVVAVIGFNQNYLLAWWDGN